MRRLRLRLGDEWDTEKEDSWLRHHKGFRRLRDPRVFRYSIYRPHSHHLLKLFLKRHIQHANMQFSKIFPFFLELPTFTRKSPSQVSVSSGSDLELCCAATGSPPPAVEWSRGQRSIDVTLNQNGCLTLKNVEDDNTGKYICRATNSFGFAQLTTEIFLQPG